MGYKKNIGMALFKSNRKFFSFDSISQTKYNADLLALAVCIAWGVIADVLSCYITGSEPSAGFDLEGESAVNWNAPFTDLT